MFIVDHHLNLDDDLYKHYCYIQICNKIGRYKYRQTDRDNKTLNDTLFPTIRFEDTAKRILQYFEPTPTSYLGFDPF